MALLDQHLAAPDPPATASGQGLVPTLSVVIPTFQAADFIPDAVSSVLSQSHAASEVIVSDDGSTDATDAALAPFGSRIRVLHNPHAGEAAARNAGLRAASGDFVAFLDADDSYLPGRLAVLAALAERRPDLDVLTTDAYLEVGGRITGRVYTPGWTFETRDQRAEILRRNFIFGHVAVRRDLALAAGGFNEGMSHTVDWELWMRLLLDGARAGAVIQPLSTYRVHASAMSSDRVSMHAGAIATLQSALNHKRIRPEERAIARTSIAQRTRLLRRSQLTSALREPVGLRRRAVVIALAPGAPPATRFKALAAVAAPATASAFAQRRSGGTRTGAGEQPIH